MRFVVTCPHLAFNNRRQHVWDPQLDTSLLTLLPPFFLLINRLALDYTVQPASRGSKVFRAHL